MRYLASLIFTYLSCIGVTACARSAAPDSVYGMEFKTIDGAPMPLSQYKGKVLLVVNTASKCGFTPQYDGLEKLYNTYKGKGLVVLGVPSNDFGGQEPGTATEIKKFCETNFNSTFPLASKEVVSGDNAHPFFKQVRKEQGLIAAPHWNFYKYLVSRDGHIVAWYSSKTKPASDTLIKAVEAELNKQPQ